MNFSQSDVETILARPGYGIEGQPLKPSPKGTELARKATTGQVGTSTYPSPYTRTLVTVRMPYIGSVLTNNHFKYRGGIHTRKEVKDWMESLGWELNLKHMDWSQCVLPLHVICDGVFKNNRRPDLSNLSKVILDAIEDYTGINDKNMRWHDGTVAFGPKPELILTIKDSKISKVEK